MRPIFLIAAFLILAVCAKAQAQTGRNGVNVIVNGSVITSVEVDDPIRPAVESLAPEYRSNASGLDRKIQELRSEKIEELIEDELILEEFKTAGYVLPESFIEDYIQDKIRKQYYGDRSRLIRELQSQGMTYEIFRKHERERYIIEAMRRQNISMDKVLISPAKIEAYYSEHLGDFKVGDQVRLRMIVISQSAGETAGRAKAMAQEILRQIDDGANFAEMAGAYSSGSARENGGDRGWVDRTYYKKELTDSAFALQPGQHSKVIEMADGCYILQVDDIRPAHVRSLEEVRSEIEKTLRGCRAEALAEEMG